MSGDDYQTALLDPTLLFKNPHEVCERMDWTREQKIKVLRVWEYDERERLVADEENMLPVKPSLLDEVLNCLLHHLGAQFDHEQSAPNKQGGCGG